MSQPPKSAKSRHHPLPLNDVVYILNDRSRWLILYELASGEARMIKELAAVIKKSESSASKHVKVLVEFGLVKIVRRAYQLAEAYRPAPGTTQIDLGYCVLRAPGSVQ